MLLVERAGDTGCAAAVAVIRQSIRAGRRASFVVAPTAMAG